MAYATAADLAAYTGKPAPPDADRLLERASVTVAYGITRYVRTDDAGNPTEHVATIRDAVCAQVEYWVTTSERVDITQDLEEPASPGRWQWDNPLAPRAARILGLAGLRNPAVPG